MDGANGVDCTYSVCSCIDDSLGYLSYVVHIRGELHKQKTLPFRVDLTYSSDIIRGNALVHAYGSTIA